MKKIVVGFVFVLGVAASSQALVYNQAAAVAGVPPDLLFGMPVPLVARQDATRAEERTCSAFPAAGCRVEGPRPYPGFVGPMPPQRCKASELRGRHHD
jgi:hypothetical protein